MSKDKNSARKFTFDTEFAGGEDRPTEAARARQKKTLTTEELENLQALARSEGENDAKARAIETLERTIAALTISVPAALAALPAGDVEIALRQAMHQALAEPRITLRAAPQVTEVLEPRLSEIAHEEGYDGRVMIAADPAMTGADCRIEWRGGGAERSEQAIEDALTALIAHRFSHTVKG